jgi:hypothetical protein
MSQVFLTQARDTGQGTFGPVRSDKISYPLRQVSLRFAQLSASDGKTIGSSSETQPRDPALCGYANSRLHIIAHLVATVSVGFASLL